MFQHFLRAFPLLREAFWIASGLLNVLGSFLDCFRLLLGLLDWFRLLLGFCAAWDCFWAVGLQGFMSCGAADLWEATGLALWKALCAFLPYSSTACVHFYSTPALSCVQFWKIQHCSCASLLYSSTACVHFHHVWTLWALQTNIHLEYILSILLSIGCIVRVYFYYVLAVYNV